jgi:transposase
VVAVARKGEAPLSQVARDCAISESCLHRSLKLADIDDDVRPAVTSGESGRVLLVRSARSCQLPMTSEGAYETKPKLRPTA